jgi:hypothetical protein
MINAYELLRIKESDLARIHREIESLRIVATLLSETEEKEVLQRDEDERRMVAQVDSSDDNKNAQYHEPLPDPTAVLFQMTKQNSLDSSPKPRRFRNWFGRAVGE